ncbi:ABC transporter ATP-binding protein [Kineothrix sedimenti]|uniref:ABC transporter ATP-binding protein n=1 Tax=Kineothrix sedimenti TaxID=3123317 RepID=A0ABZ3EV48_9FIRM
MNAIQVENVSKVYRIYDRPSDRLKEAIRPGHKIYHRPFYALNDISFSIESGETVGIIGVNGSGKSTILKIITGVLKQTEGNVFVNGKVSALLELGAGFDEEYTGIENIYMNGSILGYTREEMDAKKEEILKFADIGDFVYQPVKTYSSGMLVRLAFALAINVEPEILIIDEALAVGDAFFQAKCFHKLEEIKQSGTTILFVSHDIVSVKKMCSRVVWLDKGVLREVGEANAVCERYMSAQIERTNAENEKLLSQIKMHNETSGIEANSMIKRFPRLDIQKAEAITGTGKVEILSFYIKDKNGKESKLLKVEEEYSFGIVARFHESLEHVIFGFELENLRGVRVFGINNFMEKKYIGQVSNNKVYEALFSLKLPRMCKGEYLITLAVAAGTQENHVVHSRIHNCQTIFVENEGFNIALIELDADTRILEYDNKDIVIR